MKTGMNRASIREASTFILQLEEAAASCEKKAAAAQWNAMTEGKPEDYEAAEKLALLAKKVYSDKKKLDRATAYLQNGNLARHSTLARQLQLAKLLLTEYSVDPKVIAELTRAETEAEQLFATFRPTFEAEVTTSGSLEDILRKERDPERRYGAWLALKSVGPVVADNVRALLRLRNQSARLAGFSDFWTMQMKLSEIDPDQLLGTLRDLASTTDEPFRKVLGKITRASEARFGARGSPLKPWHLADPFFQEVPDWAVSELPGDAGATDPVASAAAYYQSIGFDVSAILARSSLYEAPGKNPHAFSLAVDRDGDVRVLCNVKNTLAWHRTMLHELGHAIYSTFIRKDLPWMLRQEAHPLTTEGIAMFFDSAAHTSTYLQRFAGVGPEQAKQLENALQERRKLSRLVFLRWCLVMIHFEMEAYRDPEQSLSDAWWTLVERYQFLQRPEGRDEPDWATKIHIVMAPAYYQNYLLGELFGAQLRKTLGGLVGSSTLAGELLFAPEIAPFLRDKIFAPGRSLTWQALLQQATGSRLDPAHLLEETAL